MVSAALLTGAAWLLLAVGCASDPREGYAFGTTYDAGVRTVAAPIFENETFARGVEFELAAALIAELERTTPYKVTSQSRADTMLSGRIRRVQLDQLSSSRQTGLSQEVVVSLTVDFEWTDLRTGAVRLKRENFTGQGLFLPGTPVGESLETGEIAAVAQLAREIVSEMRAAW